MNTRRIQEIQLEAGLHESTSVQQALLKVWNECEQSQNEEIKALGEIENAMERWHHGRDNDDETLKTINDVLYNVGRLTWFNKER
jgi:hypothetical protein